MCAVLVQLFWLSLAVLLSLLVFLVGFPAASLCDFGVALYHWVSTAFYPSAAVAVIRRGRRSREPTSEALRAAFISPPTRYAVPVTVQPLPVSSNNSLNTDLLLDTGAEVSVISQDFYRQLGSPRLISTSTMVKSAFQDQHRTLGRVCLSVTLPSTESFVEDFLVVTNSDRDILLSCPAIERHIGL